MEPNPPLNFNEFIHRADDIASKILQLPVQLEQQYILLHSLDQQQQYNQEDLFGHERAVQNKIAEMIDTEKNIEKTTSEIRQNLAQFDAHCQAMGLPLLQHATLKTCDIEIMAPQARLIEQLEKAQQDYKNLQFQLEEEQKEKNDLQVQLEKEKEEKKELQAQLQAQLKLTLVQPKTEQEFIPAQLSSLLELSPIPDQIQQQEWNPVQLPQHSKSQRAEVDRLAFHCLEATTLNDFLPRFTAVPVEIRTFVYKHIHFKTKLEYHKYFNQRKWFLTLLPTHLYRNYGHCPPEIEQYVNAFFGIFDQDDFDEQFISIPLAVRVEVYKFLYFKCASGKFYFQLPFLNAIQFSNIYKIDFDATPDPKIQPYVKDCLSCTDLTDLQSKFHKLPLSVRIGVHKSLISQTHQNQDQLTQYESAMQLIPADLFEDFGEDASENIQKFTDHCFLSSSSDEFQQRLASIPVHLRQDVFRTLYHKLKHSDYISPLRVLLTSTKLDPSYLYGH